MVPLSDLTPRELAVATMLGRRWTVKRIACELGVTPRRVYALVTAIAVKIQVEEGCDDQLCVGDWWRRTFPVLAKMYDEAA